MSTLEKYFQPNIAFAIVLGLALFQYAVLVVFILGGSPDFLLGGDFVVFWSASREMLGGNLVDLYTPQGIEAAIEAHRPQVEITGLTWQYPPHASLIFSPIGYLPFELAYALWCGLGLAVFASALWAVGLRGRFLFAALATLPILTALNTGQNALFTGSLLLAAICFAKPKPVLAGLAAALLTVKPQLGILLPVLYVASGHWRAFAVAAFGSVSLWIGSALLIGVPAWMAFIEFVGVISGSVSDGVMPLFKMVNVYAASRMAGLPELLALGLAAGMILLAIGAIVWTSRATDDARWHYGVVAAATLLAAPYSMYYELVLLVPAIFFVLQRGAENGFLQWERESLALLVLLTLLLPGPAIQLGLSLPFVTCGLVTIILYRRLRAEFGTIGQGPTSLSTLPKAVSH